LKVWDIFAILSPLYGCEIWLLPQRVIRSPKTAEMKFMRRTAEYSLLVDHRRNGDILEEVKVDPAENKFSQYKQKWLNHVRRMEDI
jgi:hypothetical protein